MAPRSSGEYFPTIDILRGFAAYSVVMVHIIAHTEWTDFPESGLLSWFRTGSLGVDLFFVISGFVVYYNAIDLFEREHFRSFLLSFSLRRVARIYPLYIATLFASIFMAQQYLLDAPDLWTQIAAHALFIHSFDFHWFSSINGVNWSIAIEVHFYILLALLIAKLQRHSGLIPFIVALVITWSWRWMSWQFLPAEGNGDQMSIYRLFVLSTQLPGRLDQFGIGMLVASFVRSSLFASWRSAPWMTWGTALASVIALYLFVFPQVNFWPSGEIAFVFARTLYAVAFSALVLTACLFGSELFMRLSAPLRYTGTISYGIYLWHLPILLVLKQSGLTPLAICALTLVSTTGVAVVSWHFFERPIIRAGRRLEAAIHPRLFPQRGALPTP